MASLVLAAPTSVHAAPATAEATTTDRATDFSSVHAVVKQALDDEVIAGMSLIILHKGETVMAEGFGYAEIKTEKPFKIDTPVILASISKPILATAANRLAVQGVVDLDVPVSNYLIYFTNRKLESGETLKRAPTMTEFFTHTSGIRNDGAKGGKPWFASWTFGKPLSHMVEQSAEYPFKTQPGTKFAYSGIGTDVAARVLEVTTQEKRNQILLDEVSKPLGMNRTFYNDEVSQKILAPMPTRYYQNEDGKLKETKRKPIHPMDTYCSSGGNILSTAPDLSRWLLMYRNMGQHEGKAYLPENTIKDMLTPIPKSYSAKGGLFIRGKDENGNPSLFNHTGSSGTKCWIDYEHDIIGIVLTQTKTPNMKSFQKKLKTAIYESLGVE